MDRNTPRKLQLAILPNCMKPKVKFCKYNLLITMEFLFIIGMAVCFVTCSKEPKEPTYAESLIKVDSLTIKNLPTVGSSGLFSIHLYGTISGDGCSSYSHYKAYWQNQDFIIEAWKQTKVHPVACPTVMVYLDEIIIFYRDSFPADFIIKVKQPNGFYLEEPMI
jgi:hypothetical protein